MRAEFDTVAGKAGERSGDHVGTNLLGEVRIAIEVLAFGVRDDLGALAACRNVIARLLPVIAVESRHDRAEALEKDGGFPGEIGDAEALERAVRERDVA